MTRSATLALCQVSSEPHEPGHGRAVGIEAAHEAFAGGADVVVLPELIVPGYTAARELLLPVAETVDGPTVSAWRALAAEHGGYVAGGFCERDGDRLFNSAVLVGPEGVLIHYRKLHLFASEKHGFSPGDLGLPVARTRFGCLGVCVCYDLRFVETVRILALRGADMVLVPTAWLPGFDRESWDETGLAPQAHGAMLQANLSQVFIACASQAGTRGGIRFLGSSILADPWGKLLAGPLPADRDETALVTIDLDQAVEARRRIPLVEPREDRRTDVYQLVLEGEEVL